MKRGFLLVSYGILLFIGGCDHALQTPSALLSLSGNDQRPRIVLSSPSELTPSIEPSTPIFVDFNVPMDTESVRRAFILSGTAAVNGTFRWAGNRVYYDLTTGLAPGSSYTLQVGNTAKSQAGYTLDVAYIVHFIVGSTVVGPRVLGTTPASSAQNIDPATTIRMVFSRAMDTVSTQNAFSISPAAAGSFAWDPDNMGVTFTPFVPLSNAATYTVSLSTGAKDTGGISIPDFFNFSFLVGTNFTRPVILSVVEVGNPVPMTDGVTGFYKDASFTVNFSAAMDYFATQSSLSVTKVSDGSFVAGSLLWNGSFTSLTFVPSAPLEPQSVYRMQVSTGAKDQSGNNLLSTFTLDFTVNNSAGAVNSDYLSITKAEEVNTPNPNQNISLLPVITTIHIGTLFPTSTVRFAFTFSRPLSAGSTFENCTFARVTGIDPQGGGRKMGIAFGNAGALTNNVLFLDFDTLAYNQVYQITVTGGRNGIIASAQGSETGSWMKNDTSVFFTITP